MPVIIGNTTGETRSWADSAGAIIDEGSHAAAIDKLFGTLARDRILAVYPANAYPTPREAFAQLRLVGSMARVGASPVVNLTIEPPGTAPLHGNLGRLGRS
jgi:hypothetical protein